MALVGAVGEGTATPDEEDLLAAGMETVLVVPATMPTRTGTRCPRRTDHRGDSPTRRRRNMALADMGGTDGRRRRRTMVVGLGVGSRGLRGVGRTVGLLEVVMGSLAIPLSRTDEVGMAAAAVVTVVVVVVTVVVVVGIVVKEVMVATGPRAGTVAVDTAVVAHTMELQEVGVAVGGSAVIYFCIFVLTLCAWL